MERNTPIRSVDLLNNDLYQFTCSYSYFVQKRHEEIASFEIFFRKYPFKGEYAIFAGLESIKDFIKNLKFTQQHQKYLKSIFPHMKEEYFTWIKQDFSEKVTFRGMKEGQIVFANQPILSYTGPIGFVQMLETPCLTLLGFASLVATNASRMTKAVYPKKCIQFGSRRAQGPDGALSASQYAFIGGFTATSNVSCGKKLQIQVVGTMSHAYVTSFSSLDDVEPFFMGETDMKQKVIQKRKQFGFKTHDGELAAFLNFAQAFPNNFTALIDSYSTLQSGILNTIIVGSALIEAGIKKIGIRLDSGDLGKLSKQCRKLWGKYIKDDTKLTISASDDLDQERLIKLEAQESEIDVYAIGTNIATCKKQPALGLVCKLVELNGVPKMKLSSTPEKATYPCLKKIYRVTSENGDIFDLTALTHEVLKKGSQIRMGTIKDGNYINTKIASFRLLNDELDMAPKKITEIKEYVEESRKHLPKQIFDLSNPKAHSLYMTQNYLIKYNSTLNKAQELVHETKQTQVDPSSPKKKVVNV